MGRLGIIGNPNSGKSSLFNALTGLRQQVANFPGVTVEKKVGSFSTSDGLKVDLIDFPGLYSLYPNSADEKLVVDILLNPSNAHHPNRVIYVADATNLERQLLLATQLIDLKIPLYFVLNMVDIADNQSSDVAANQISEYLGCPVFGVSAKTGFGIEALKENISSWLKKDESPKYKRQIKLKSKEQELVQSISALFPEYTSYQALLVGHHHSWLTGIDAASKEKIFEITKSISFESLKYQIAETLDRYKNFEGIINSNRAGENKFGLKLTRKIDKILTHKSVGALIFFAIMFFVFQAIYAFAEYPMEWIERLFAFSSEYLGSALGNNWFSNLCTDGILAGLSGVLVFIPQIAILFFLISLLEEVGYMSRAVYMFDHIMRKFGLNGRSMVALISSGACAIPAIMSTRTISNWKERITTIMVAPLISCSARIPVYTILIGFAVPDQMVFGMFNLQGIAFMGLYFLGIFMAFMAAFVFKFILKNDELSYLVIELPIYKAPIWRNVFLNIKEKVGAFVLEAGKIILIISIVLWFLSSYSLPGRMMEAEQQAVSQAQELNLSEEEGENLIMSMRVETSFAGIIGKSIEPAIAPLGFDWKMGIALITSFAAREVFVGTMATIYSVGSADNELTLRERMSQEINPSTGLPVYNMATSFSLLIFYVFAMQCMSTLAITKKETNSWKWPIVQFSYMSILAYMSSLLVFQIFS